MEQHSPNSEGGAAEESLHAGDRLDEPVVTVPCYEPSGRRIEISGRALCTHTLALGQTGSGKTSVLRWFIRDLIYHHAQDPSLKAGLFVFDLNGDETVGLVRKWVHEAGREGDLRLLTPDEGHLDLFAGIKSLDDLSRATSLFMTGSWVNDTENGYWTETTRTLIDAALGIYLMVKGRLEIDGVLGFLTNWLIARQPTLENEKLLADFDLLTAKAPEHLDSLSLGKLEIVRATVAMWSKLDLRTKGILTSCLLNAVGGLVAPEARRYLDARRGELFVPEQIGDGAILVFSFPAALKIEAATLLGKILKARLYAALQQRNQDRGQRLCAIMADEYHYLASGGVERSSDVTALATLRSRNVAVVAASQSLEHLASVMKLREFQSLLPNFGNHFFFRSTEMATGGFADAIMGFRRIRNPSHDEQGDLLFRRPLTPVTERICPPGTLARLESGHAFVSLSTGFRTEQALWLAGNHETVVAAAKLTKPAADPWERLREAAFPPASTKLPPSSEALPWEEESSSCQPLFYDYSTWMTVLEEHRFHRGPYRFIDEFQEAFSRLNQTPSGLGTLPSCWWEAVVNLTRKFLTAHSAQILGLYQEEGCLFVVIVGNDPRVIYTEWSARLQRSIYPSRHRELKRRDQRRIHLRQQKRTSFPSDKI
jgi:hypothetical protein